MAYGGWIRALVTMATSYHSSSAAAIFYPKLCFVHTGGFALKWLYYVPFILHIVRVSTSRMEIPVSEIDKISPVSCINFMFYALFPLHKTVYVSDVWEDHAFHSRLSLGRLDFIEGKCIMEWVAPLCTQVKNKCKSPAQCLKRL